MNEIKLKHKNLKYSVYNKSVQFCHINVNAYIKNQNIGSEVTLTGKLPFYQLFTMLDLANMTETNNILLGPNSVISLIKEIFKYEYVEMNEGFILFNNKDVLKLNRINIWSTEQSLRYNIGENGENIPKVLEQLRNVMNTNIKRVNIIKADFVPVLKFEKTSNAK